MSLYDQIVAREEAVSLVGLGYVGMPIAVAFARKVNVIGYDYNAAKIDLYKSGIDPTNEVVIDTKAVLTAAGTKWNFLKFVPGLVGGHCIGVDPYYLTYRAEQLGYHSQVILAGRRINDDSLLRN